MFDISRTLQRLKGAAELFPAKTHRYSYGIASEFHRDGKKPEREKEKRMNLLNVTIFHLSSHKIKNNWT